MATIADNQPKSQSFQPRSVYFRRSIRHTATSRYAPAIAWKKVAPALGICRDRLRPECGVLQGMQTAPGIWTGPGPIEFSYVNRKALLRLRHHLRSSDPANGQDRFGTIRAMPAYQPSPMEEETMNGLIYLIGLIVVIMAILSIFGLR
jgi:hypothetical protein